jgi:predicted dehydrogenase
VNEIATESASESEGSTIDRRTLIKSAGGLALGLATLAHGAEPARKRFAIVGLGSRSRMYIRALIGKYREGNELVAICDSNPGRLALAGKLVAGEGVPTPKMYNATDFDRMIREAKPQTLIVTTPDATHDDYIVRALDAGCNVLTEKPLTTTPEKAQRILDACKRNNRHLRVMFNYRYSPPRTQVKDLLMSNEIGDILSVDFNWLLNTQHGADYFRRWHSHKAISGGLMIHKATHHFDLVNWWLGAYPDTVLAYGKREFYTPATAKRMGLKSHHERCRTCPEKTACTFYMDLEADKNLRQLYLENEHFDGYFRDQCVFRPDIDIEDAMNVIVRYNTGATLSYSLNACNAWEGYRIAFNGTKGRLEHEIVEQIYIAGANMTQGGIADDGVHTRIIPLRGAARDIKPWTGTGGHGGGDDVMLNEVFGTAPADKYKRASDERGGCYSILIGAAANKCFQSGQAVRIGDLVTGLTPPEYAPMPTREMPVPMPRKVELNRT